MKEKRLVQFDSSDMDYFSLTSQFPMKCPKCNVLLVGLHLTEHPVDVQVTCRICGGVVHGKDMWVELDAGQK